MTLSKARIAAMLTTEQIGQTLIVLDETDSTNRVAKEMAVGGAAHGTVIVADTQTAGRGQKGRAFFSPAGCGLYISVILRDLPMADAAVLTPYAGVAAAQAIESVAPVTVQIKWVNDLVIGGKKVAGILTEGGTAQGDVLDFAVVGIGINVCHVDFPDELAAIAGTLEDAAHAPIDREAVLAAVLNELEQALGNLSSREWMDAYRRRSSILGQTVTVTEGDAVYTATAVAIDNDGALTVERGGATKRLIYGEVRVR